MLISGAGDATPEAELSAADGDRRLAEAIAAFNSRSWYAAHDSFEELWQENDGPLRRQLQGILQIAVAQYHLERGNRHGAMVLMGEGIGRLVASDPEELGLNLEALVARVKPRLEALQRGQDPSQFPDPVLEPLERPL